jgi:hypothetical protein
VHSAWQRRWVASGGGGGDDAGSEPRCRQCGYVVAPQSRRMCPECGGDLRAVGVIGRQVRRRPDDPIGWIIGIGVFLAPLALLAAFRFGDYLPAVFQRYAATTTIPTHLPATQPGEPEPVIKVTSSGWRGLTHQPPTSLDVAWWSFDDYAMRWSVEFYKSENRRTWRWDAPLRTQAATRPTRPTRPNLAMPPTRPTRETHGTVDAFDDAAARRFIELAGLDPQSPAGAALSEQTLEQVRRLQRCELPRGAVRTRYSGESPAVTYYGGGFPRALVIAGIVWLPAWWLIARRLRRRFERHMRAAEAEEQSTLDALGVER